MSAGRLRQLYAQNDKDANGKLTKEELIPILTQYLGYNAAPYVKELMAVADVDGSGTINSVEELDIALRKINAVALQSIFKKYDKDGNLALNKKELTPLLEEILGVDPSPYVDEVMQAGDWNGTGTIDTLDELQVALDETNMIKAWALQNQFRFYDAQGSGDGFITKQDIAKVTESMSPDRKKELLSLFKKADVNGDGKVSLQEYMNHMM